MRRIGKWFGFAGGLVIATFGSAGLSRTFGQTVAPVSSVWSDANTALRETQQGGRPTVIVALSASGVASDKLRNSLPTMLGRSYQFVEVDSDDQREWMRQIGITGVPGIALYAPSETGIKLIGTRSGVAEPAMILGWINGMLRVGAAGPTPTLIDPRVTRTAYQQASPQNPTPQYVAPPPPTPAPSLPVYAPAPVYSPPPVYYSPAPTPIYYGPAPGSAPVFTNPAPAPMSVSPSAAPIMVNPPQQTIVIGPQPAPNVVSAAPNGPAGAPPAPAPTQMFLATPAPAPAPMQMVAMAPAAAPAPMQMVAMAPAPAPVQMVAAAPISTTAQFVATAPAPAAASPSSMVVTVKPQRLRNRIGTSIGQFLIEKNKQKFDLVQTATLASSPGLAPAATFSYAASGPQPVCLPNPAPDYAPEPLPPLPSAQSGDCGACRKGNCLRHRHGR